MPTSKGRFELGLGRGISPSILRISVDPADRQKIYL